MKPPPAAGVMSVAVPSHFISVRFRRHAVRKGFTLIELLVVVALIAVLIALLAPATCRVRRAAVRMQCMNNLKQLGIATHNYLEAEKHFPSGTVPGTTLPPDQRMSFYATLLPYLEQNDLFRKLKPGEAWDSPANQAAFGPHTSGRMFACLDWMNERGQTNGAAAATGHLAVTNYVGVAGVGADAAERPAGAAGVGIFGYDRTPKSADVKDGLANTMLLIETGYEVGPWLRGGPTTVRPIDPNAGQLTGDGLPFGGTHFLDATLFEPTRAEGFHVLLADASIHTTQNSIHPGVLAALATAAGGDEVPGDW
jgi:prepilin-type N-terminal cleavage/methylation domain-containing protein